MLYHINFLALLLIMTMNATHFPNFFFNLAVMEISFKSCTDNLILQTFFITLQNNIAGQMKTILLLNVHVKLQFKMVGNH